MSKFQELYNADIARYGGKPELYIKIFLFLYRKAATVSFAPVKFLYKAMFRFWANRRGLEVAANQQIRGGYIWDMHIISQSIVRQWWVEIAIYIRVW